MLAKNKHMKKFTNKFDRIWENPPSTHLVIFREIASISKYSANSNKLLTVAGHLVLAVTNIRSNLLPFICVVNLVNGCIQTLWSSCGHLV